MSEPQARGQGSTGSPVSSPLGPGGRPFRGMRAVPLILAVGAFAANAVILLSDRAPGIFRRVGARIDAGVSRAAGATGIDVPGRNVRVPQSDFDVHVAIWGIAAVLVGLGMWSWLSLAAAEGTVFASSVALELSQRVFTTTRTVSLGDVIGNATGVLAGTGVVVVFVLAWRAVTTRRSSPDR